MLLVDLANNTVHHTSEKKRNKGNTSYSIQELKSHLKIDLEDKIEHAIIEFNPDDLTHNLGLKSINLDLLVITENNIETTSKLCLCEITFASFEEVARNARELLVLGSNNYLDFLGKREFLTYGSNVYDDFFIDTPNINTKRSSFKYRSNMYTTKLLGRFNILNVMCVLSILEIIGQLKHRRFNKFLRKNRFDSEFDTLYKSKNKLIFLYYGDRKLEDVVQSVVEIRNNFNYKLFYFISSHGDIVEDLVEFKKAKHTYLVNDNEDGKELLISTETRMFNSCINNLQCAEQFEQTYKKAISDLKENEVLIVYGRSSKEKIEILRSKNGKL